MEFQAPLPSIIGTCKNLGKSGAIVGVAPVSPDRRRLTLVEFDPDLRIVRWSAREMVGRRLEDLGWLPLDETETRNYRSQKSELCN